mgnify:CR=1 FL=1
MSNVNDAMLALGNIATFLNNMCPVATILVNDERIKAVDELDIIRQYLLNIKNPINIGDRIRITAVHEMDAYSGDNSMIGRIFTLEGLPKESSITGFYSFNVEEDEGCFYAAAFEKV